MAAVLSAKIRATIIWLQTPVQFPGASAVYPSSISRQPNGHKAIFDITNSLIGENVAASEIIATCRPNKCANHFAVYRILCIFARVNLNQRDEERNQYL